MNETLGAIGDGAVLGSVLPPLTAVVQSPRWSANVKRAVAVVVALIGGVAAVAAQGGLEQFTHGVPTLATMVAVLAASEATYGLVWKPSRIAPEIEKRTSGRGRYRA